MKHIVVAITARASLARVQTVIEALHGRCSLTIVTAGSATNAKYGRVADEPIIHELGLEVVECVSVEPHGYEGAAAYTGHLTAELTTLFSILDPDVVVVIADRYETLAVSIAASYLNIPLCHLLGGERSGNIDDKVRFANTALADIHCVPTQEAYRTVSRYHTNVHMTGCPSVDLALRARQPSPDVLNATGIGPEFDPAQPYVVALYHPCQADKFTPRELFAAVVQAAQPTHQVLWFWPNIDPGAERVEKELRLEHEHYAPVRFYRHLPAEEFLGLLKGAALLIGNSSVGVREASILGTPVMNLGYRQRGRLKPVNVMHRVELDKDFIYEQLAHGPYEPDYTYGRGNAGQAIAEVLLNG